jgi:murein DD-endopeptidase MepM/ murein hydrolase activator NlpD
MAKAYNWPVEPFDRQHPVRGYFSDPRDGEKRSTFHFGIDVAVPDGTPVFAVEAGTVDMGGKHNVAVVSAGGDRVFGYWHLDPVVKHKQRVAQHALLGHVGKGWGHVHFAERIRGGDYLNPVRRGALRPYADPSSPRIERIVVSRGGQEIGAEQVKGAVDLVVEAFDRPAMQVPDPKWRDMPVAPALIRWRIVRSGKAVVPWTNAADFRSTKPPDNRFTRIYAPGSRQNHPNQPGRYRFFLARGWKSGAHPAGEYRLDVEASDIEGNKAVAHLVLVLRKGR